METWKAYPGCDLYEISTMGRVRSVARHARGRWGSMRRLAGRDLSLATANNGYLFFGLCENGKQTPCYVHRAVLQTFIGPAQVDQEACHINGDRQDNRLENLRWDTRSNNAMDKLAHGTMRLGESHGMSKLTADVVRSIRQDSRSSVELAEELGVNHSTVQRIRRRETWRHVE